MLSAFYRDDAIYHIEVSHARISKFLRKPCGTRCHPFCSTFGRQRLPCLRRIQRKQLINSDRGVAETGNSFPFTFSLAAPGNLIISAKCRRHSTPINSSDDTSTPWQVQLCTEPMHIIQLQLDSVVVSRCLAADRSKIIGVKH